MKKQLLLLVCLLSISINYSQTFNDGVLEYTVISSTNVSVKKNNDVCPIGSLTIPNTVVNSGITYTIISIQNNAFDSCIDLTSITIPNSVTNIGDSAFADCLDLSSVTIPDSVTSIGYNTFSNCIALESITIPNSVTSIGVNTFFNCSGLASIIIPNSVTSIGDYAFMECGNLMSIIISNSVTSIGNNVFENCNALTSVIIPNSVTSIGDYTFMACSSLANITIPNSVISIGLGTFMACSSLTNLTIPNSVTNIGEYAFTGCSGLTSVTVNWGTPLVVPISIFQGVPVNTIPLTVPSGTTALYQSAAVWQDFAPIVLSTENFIENNINIQLFPNPVHNQLNITINKDLSLKMIKIYNNLGKLIIQSKVPTINVSKLQGIYLIQIITDKGNVTKKVIVK